MANRTSVHNMGDAGMILFGPIGREVLSFGTVLFAVCKMKHLCLWLGMVKI